MSDDLRSAIDQARQTQRALIEATSAGDAFDQKELVRLRSQFQQDMLAISQQSRSDPKLNADMARANEFAKRHRETQDMLSRHQSKWLLHEIERDRQGYEDATTALRKAQDEYFKWAKSYLAAG